jgi:hypothetical protein
MGHGTAEDMIEHFVLATADLDLTKLQQISMDGPNVNWKFHRLYQQKLLDEHENTLLDIGSCGLHIVNAAFKHGGLESGWDIQKLLSSLHYLFNDVPARREDYTNATGSDVFPLKFCSHRWVENVPVAERALLIWDNMKKYVQKVEAKAYTSPTTASYDTVKKFAADVLTVAKLSCFISIAKQVTPFLTQYQSDRPLVPFLGDDLSSLLKSLMKRFMKRELLVDISVGRLVQLDPQEKNNFIVYSQLDIGFGAEQELKKLLSSKKISLFVCIVIY